MKYAHYDEITTKLLGWYDDNIHTVIPTPNVEVTEEVWQTAIDSGANAIVNGLPTTSDFRTAEEILAEAITAWKIDRAMAVEAIEVTHNTVVYQGDEESQTRMARAIVALPDDVTTVDWVAKDNSVNALTRLDLQAILLDAGNQQSAIWNVGRPV